MGYTNETTHYGIPLPLGTDKTTPMDYNESMQEIDTALFGAKTDSDSALRKAQQVEEGLSQTDDDVSSLKTRVTNLEGTSVTHGNAIQQNAQDIADVRADALDMIEAKDEGTAQVATVAVLEGEYFRYNDVLYIATRDIDINDTIVPNTNCKATNVGTELNKLHGDLDDVKDTNVILLTVPAGTVWSTACERLQAAIVNAYNNGNGVNRNKFVIEYGSVIYRLSKCAKTNPGNIVFEGCPEKHVFASISLHGTAVSGDGYETIQYNINNDTWSHTTVALTDLTPLDLILMY